MKALLVADLHLRSDRPICRNDEDWIGAQRGDLQYIGKLCRDNNIDEVWLLGDIFHHPVEPPEIVNMAIEEINAWNVTTRTICGNHDLKYHNIDNFNSCSIATLFHSGTVTHFENVAAFDFCQEKSCNDEVVLLHKLVFPDDKTKGPAVGFTADNMVRDFPKAKCILMGDYHNGWDRTIGDTKLTMVGCMNIQSGALKDYEPRAVILDTETYSMESKYLPNHHECITVEHLVEAEKRDTRLEACINSVSSVESQEFDFIGNLRELARTNNKAEQIITELVEALNETKR